MDNRIIINTDTLTPVEDLREREFIKHYDDVWFVTEVDENRVVHIKKLVGLGTVGLELRAGKNIHVQRVALEKATFRNI